MAQRARGGDGAPQYNHYGQKIGGKGERTRQMLIAATVDLLESRGLRDVAVVDVARAANLSAATFYVYFRGVPEVVLAALAQASFTTPELEDLIARDWRMPGAALAAQRFVEGYTRLWNANGVIFRVRNLAAEEGDQRFREARLRATRPLMTALEDAASRAQANGRLPQTLAPRACAATLLMMLERLAAVGPMTPSGPSLSYRSLKQAAAHTLMVMLGADA